ncbi:MAG: hypothetical protein NVSMB42_06450 [Herpetosiphon sp.]
MIQLRPAELADWPMCAALRDDVQSSYVWQVNVAPDISQPLTTADLAITVRRARLPRPVLIHAPSQPLEPLWHQAAGIYVAESMDGLVGYVMLSIIPTRPALEISRLVVAPPARQQGISTLLLHHAAASTRDAGYTALTAACPARNYPGNACLVRAGFAFAGYNEALYDRGEIALIWQRSV